MSPKLITALGNPGSEYKNTRHNIGFDVLDTFCEKYKISKKKEDKFSSWYGKGNVVLGNNQYDLILAWPTTFMNNSGNAVSKLLSWFKLEPKDLIVVHDEVAINLGKVRLNFDSGAAGHHGVESIIQMIGGVKEFTRLRVGVGPDPGGDKRRDFVLERFTSDEEIIVNKVIDVSVNALEDLITNDVEKVMNKYNGVEIN